MCCKHKNGCETILSNRQTLHNKLYTVTITSLNNQEIAREKKCHNCQSKPSCNIDVSQMLSHAHFYIAEKGWYFKGHSKSQVWRLPLICISNFNKGYSYFKGINGEINVRLWSHGTITDISKAVLVWHWTALHNHFLFVQAYFRNNEGTIQDLSLFLNLNLWLIFFEDRYLHFKHLLDNENEGGGTWLHQHSVATLGQITQISQWPIYQAQ